MWKLRFIVSGGLGIAFLLAGCGESSIGALSVSKQELIRQADLICNRGDEAQSDELEAFTTKHKKKLEELAPVPYEAMIGRGYVIPSVKKQIRRLESLEPPDGERKEFEAILAGFNAAVRMGERDPYSIANFWDRTQDPLAPINRVATRYGFKSCNELR